MRREVGEVNAVDHFATTLATLPIERLNDLLTLRVNGPDREAAVVMTILLREMVFREVLLRRGLAQEAA
jgi:hypothetical protein